MRILIAASAFYPDVNGVSTITNYIAKGLSANHEVLVLADSHMNTLPQYGSYGSIKIERIYAEQTGFVTECVGEKQRYLDWIKENSPDCFICVCSQYWPYDWIKDYLDEINCVKVFFTHGYSQLRSFTRIFKHALTLHFEDIKPDFYWLKYYANAYKFIEKFDIVTYLSQNNNAYLYAQKYKLSNGIILYNAVDDSFYTHHNYITTDDDYSQKNISFICVSNFMDGKNQKFLLNAFYRLKSLNNKLILIGNSKTDYYNEMQKLQKKLEKTYGHRDVIYMTGLSRNQIIDQLNMADVFVFSSKSEQYPTVLCEACAIGLPIITTDVGHAKEIPGALIASTPSNMANKMKSLIDNRQIKKLGLLNRCYAEENYRIDSKVAYLNNQIEKCFHERKSTSLNNN